MSHHRWLRPRPWSPLAAGRGMHHHRGQHALVSASRRVLIEGPDLQRHGIIALYTEALRLQNVFTLRCTYDSSVAAMGARHTDRPSHRRLRVEWSAPRTFQDRLGPSSDSLVQPPSRRPTPRSHRFNARFGSGTAPCTAYRPLGPGARTLSSAQAAAGSQGQHCEYRCEAPIAARDGAARCGKR